LFKQLAHPQKINLPHDFLLILIIPQAFTVPQQFTKNEQKASTKNFQDKKKKQKKRVAFKEMTPTIKIIMIIFVCIHLKINEQQNKGRQGNQQ